MTDAAEQAEFESQHDPLAVVLAKGDARGWDDIWEALAIAERPDLAEWTRSYVGYVRADIEKVIAELTLSASQPPEPSDAG